MFSALQAAKENHQTFAGQCETREVKLDKLRIEINAADFMNIFEVWSEKKTRLGFIKKKERETIQWILNTRRIHRQVFQTHSYFHFHFHSFI